MSITRSGARATTTTNNSGDATFAAHQAESEGVKPKAPRLYHKKSRTGCQRCRARRVKCNEVHPVCGGCERYHVPCVYDHRKSNKDHGHEAKKKSGNSDAGSGGNNDLNLGGADSLGLPETKQRRILELKLLHNFMVNTILTFPGTSDESAIETWTVFAPRLAFDHEAVLYSMYSLSALHLAKLEPNNPEAMFAYSSYLDLALREHCRDMAHISEANTDAICLASSFLRCSAFATLQDRPIVPYEPPVHWMQMTSGAGEVFRATWNWIGTGETSIAARIVKRSPILTRKDALGDERNRQGLLHLLRRGPAEVSSEPWDVDVEDVYKSTLSYIGGIQAAMNEKEPEAEIWKRLIIFPIIVPKRFLKLAEERRPRALVVLAHFFGHLSRFRHIWWVGDTAKREIHGIQSILPPEWQDLLHWPLLTLGLDPESSPCTDCHLLVSS